MRRAQDMYQYCLVNGTGTGTMQSWSAKHFEVIEKALQPGEHAAVCFVGMHNYISGTKHSGNFSYAITNKRFVMGQKKMVGQNFMAVFLENLNDISMSSGLVNHILTIDTIKECFNINFHDKRVLENVYNLSHEHIQRLRTQTAEPRPQQAPISNPMEQIQQAYTMMEKGIITQKEFEKIKSDLI